MNERQFHFSYTGAGVLATVFGVIAASLGIACFFIDGRSGAATGFLGMHFAVGSALFRVRAWLSKLGVREQNAFDLGQDSARVRSLR